jgi:hypothetical protein
MKQVKVQSLIYITARQKGFSGSCKAWIVARNLDHGGSGRLLKSDLYQEIENYTTKRTRQRWIKEALQLGIFTVSKCGKYFRFISLDKVASVYSCSNLVTPVLIEIEDLFRPGLSKYLWAGYLESRNDQQPISRATLESITGVSESTQRVLEGDNEHIDKYYCFTDLGDTEDPQGAYENIKNSPDQSIKIKGKKIIKQLPNTYKSKGIKQARKGATKKYQDKLNSRCQGKREKPLIKIFHKSIKAALHDSQKYNQVKYCFIKHDRAGVNWFRCVIPEGILI